ncbi:MAG: tyrosine-type recombinase/integrase [Filomicrobium sp.]
MNLALLQQHALGLLDYREVCRSEDQTRVFPEMPTASDGYQSSAFSKRFSRYLQKCGVKTDKRLSFHSFRHTIKDLMREAGIDRSGQDAICGHEDGSVQASYGRGYSPAALHKQL